MRRTLAFLEERGLVEWFREGIWQHSGKPPGKAALRAEGMERPPSSDVLRRMRERLQALPPQDPEPFVPRLDPAPAAVHPEPEAPGEHAFSQRGDAASASGIVNGSARPTVPEVMERWGIDPEEWEPERVRVQEWTAHMKLKRRNIVPTTAGGEQLVRLEDVPHETRAWLVRLTLRRIKGSTVLRALAADLLADVREAAAARPVRTPLRRASRSEGVLAVLHAPDLHAGKVALDGAEWDAPAAFSAAVDDLLDKVAGYDTARVLLTVGNDAMNTDGSRRTTTRGTPQDNGHAWRETFRAVCAMYRRAIDRALGVAPVSVVVVPGNHDRDSCFYLGDVLAATFAHNDHVSVTNEAHPRTYHLHGRCLLGMTHGDGCKLTELPRLMSEEAAPLWAQATAAREWLTGHRHALEVQSIGSCVVRTSDALSPTDAWHAGRGYTGSRRAAECLLYHGDAGRIGVLSAPLAALDLAA